MTSLLQETRLMFTRVFCPEKASLYLSVHVDRSSVFLFQELPIFLLEQNANLEKKETRCLRLSSIEKNSSLYNYSFLQKIENILKKIFSFLQKKEKNSYEEYMIYQNEEYYLPEHFLKDDNFSYSYQHRSIHLQIHTQEFLKDQETGDVSLNTPDHLPQFFPLEKPILLNQASNLNTNIPSELKLIKKQVASDFNPTFTKNVNISIEGSFQLFNSKIFTDVMSFLFSKAFFQANLQPYLNTKDLYRLSLVNKNCSLITKEKLQDFKVFNEERLVLSHVMFFFKNYHWREINYSYKLTFYFDQKNQFVGFYQKGRREISQLIEGKTNFNGCTSIEMENTKKGAILLDDLKTIKSEEIRKYIKIFLNYSQIIALFISQDDKYKKSSKYIQEIPTNTWNHLKDLAEKYNFATQKDRDNILVSAKEHIERGIKQIS